MGCPKINTLCTQNESLRQPASVDVTITKDHRDKYELVIQNGNDNISWETSTNVTLKVEQPAGYLSAHGGGGGFSAKFRVGVCHPHFEKWHRWLDQFL